LTRRAGEIGGLLGGGLRRVLGAPARGRLGGPAGLGLRGAALGSLEERLDFLRARSFRLVRAVGSSRGVAGVHRPAGGIRRVCGTLRGFAPLPAFALLPVFGPLPAFTPGGGQSGHAFGLALRLDVLRRGAVALVLRLPGPRLVLATLPAIRPGGARAIGLFHLGQAGGIEVGGHRRARLRQRLGGRLRNAEPVAAAFDGDGSLRESRRGKRDVRRYGLG
jgi:hypothetical protein